MKKKIVSIIVLMIIITAIIQINVYANTTATVNTESLNLRKEASTTSNIIKILNKGDNVEVVLEDGDWCKIKIGDVEGYVKKEYLKIEKTTNDKTEQNSEVETNQQEKNEISTVANFAVEDDIIVVNDNTDIRIIPTINSNIIGRVQTGTKLEIITKTNHWFFVQNDSISGWIFYRESKQSNLESEEEVSNNQAEENLEDEKATEKIEENTNNNSYEQTTKYVKESSIYIRKGPSTDTEALASLIKNTDVTVVGEENGWYKIKYNDSYGYIREDLLSDKKITETSRDGEEINRNILEEASGTGSDIVNYAYNYLGCPYVYGGSGPSSFDCSGFTAYVYSHFGYSLPHSAVTQMNYGVEVASDELCPGDLVFFLDYQTMDGVGHCGIYIGNGEFIHASSGTGYCVKTSTLLSGSYKTRYYTARRLV